MQRLSGKFDFTPPGLSRCSVRSVASCLLCFCNCSVRHIALHEIVLLAVELHLFSTLIVDLVSQLLLGVLQGIVNNIPTRWVTEQSPLKTAESDDWRTWQDGALFYDFFFHFNAQHFKLSVRADQKQVYCRHRWGMTTFVQMFSKPRGWNKLVVSGWAVRCKKINDRSVLPFRLLRFDSTLADRHPLLLLMLTLNRKSFH